MRPLRALALVTVVAGAPALVVACSKVPTVPQQATVASYAAALESCVATARATDGGLASYVACRDHVDQQYGRAPEKDGGQ